MTRADYTQKAPRAFGRVEIIGMYPEWGTCFPWQFRGRGIQPKPASFSRFAAFSKSIVSLGLGGSIREFPTVDAIAVSGGALVLMQASDLTPMAIVSTDISLPGQGFLFVFPVLSPSITTDWIYVDRSGLGGWFSSVGEGRCMVCGDYPDYIPADVHNTRRRAWQFGHRPGFAVNRV